MYPSKKFRVGPPKANPIHINHKGTNPQVVTNQATVEHVIDPSKSLIPIERGTRGLVNAGIFSHVPQEKLEYLNRLGTYYLADKGTMFIKQGEPQERLFFVLNGELRVYFGEKDVMHMLATIRQNESVGEANIFYPSEATASIVASQPTELWCMSKKQMTTFMLTHPDASISMASEVVTLLSQRIQKLNQKTSTLLDDM